MKRKLLLTLLLLPVFAFAANTHTGTVAHDSAWYRQLVEQAGNRLQQRVALNENLKRQGRQAEMQFVINIMPGAGEPYLIDEAVGDGVPLLGNHLAEKQTLESQLKNIYSTYHVEAYLLLLNYFDVKMKYKVKGNYSIDDVFNGNLLDDNLNIQEMKDLHELITNRIAAGQGIFADTSARILLSVGVYKGFKMANITSYFCSKIKPNKNNGYVDKEVGPLLYSYLQNTDANPADGSLAYPKYHVSCLEKAVISSRQKAKILQTLTVPGLVDILNQFKNEADYAALSVAERLHCLSLLVSETMAGNYLLNNNEEGLAIKIIRTAPKAQIKALQDGLLQPSVLTVNSNYNGVDKANKFALLVRLTDRIQDGFLFGIGANNYSRFLATLLVQFKSVTDPELPKTLDSTKYYYYGVLLRPDGCYEEGGNLTVDVDNYGKVTLSEVYSFESSCKYIDRGLFEIPRGSYGAFEPVGLTFLSDPDQDLFPGGVKGKLYVVPAIYVADYRNKRMTKLVEATAHTTFGLLPFAGIEEFEAAKGWWKAFLLFNAVTNTANVVIQYPEVRSKLQSTPGGATFLFYWDRCIDISNGVYLTPLAYKFVKGLVTSFRSMSAAEKAALGSKADDVEKTVDDVAREIGEEGAALTSAGKMLTTLERLGLTNLKSLSQTALARLEGLTDDILRQLDRELGDPGFGPGLRKLLEGDAGAFARVLERVKDVFFKSVDDLGATYDADGKLSAALRQEVYDLYKRRQWDKIEKIFNDNDINWKWPPGSGAYNVTMHRAKKGDIWDRYQYKVGTKPDGSLNYGGAYVSPVNGVPYDYASRALKGAEAEYDLYYRIEILKDFPFDIEKGNIIPWWGHKGDGIQFKLPAGKEIPYLLDNGYIKITPVSSPSNNIKF